MRPRRLNSSLTSISEPSICSWDCCARRNVLPLKFCTNKDCGYQVCAKNLRAATTPLWRSLLQPVPISQSWRSVRFPRRAEIEVDNAFLGHTPGEVPLAIGERMITVSKQG